MRLRRHPSKVEIPAQVSRTAPERFVVRAAGEQHHLYCAMCRTVVAYGVSEELSAADLAFYGEMHACSTVARRGPSIDS